MGMSPNVADAPCGSLALSSAPSSVRGDAAFVDGTSSSRFNAAGAVTTVDGAAAANGAEGASTEGAAAARGATTLLAFFGTYLTFGGGGGGAPLIATPLLQREKCKCNTNGR